VYRMPGEQMDDKRCFEILEIDDQADLATVKQAYRDLIAIWHPDRYAHNYRLQKRAEEKTKEINAAYERIKDRFFEKKNRDPRMQNQNGIRRAASSKSFDKENGGRTDSESKQATWSRTEARLAEIARKKRVADERRAYFAKNKAKESLKKAQNPRAREKPPDRQNQRDDERASDKRRRREKTEEKHRKHAWLAAEAKLRKLSEAKVEYLARLQAVADENKKAHTVSSEKPFMLIRPFHLVMFCCSVILLFFFSGIAQNYTHLNLFLLIILGMAVLFGSRLLVQLYKRQNIRLLLRVTAVICAALVVVFLVFFLLTSKPDFSAKHLVQALFTIN